MGVQRLWELEEIGSLFNGHVSPMGASHPSKKRVSPCSIPYCDTRTLMTQPLMQYHNAEFVLTNNGEIFVSAGTSITADCIFDFATYPYDYQNCSIIMFSPMYNAARYVFSSVARNPIRGRSPFLPPAYY